jgi:transposase
MTEREAEEAVAAHYGMLLGIQSPWKVKRAKLEIAQRLVEIEVEHELGRPVRCPQCQRECRRHDHAPGRRWRHWDVMQFTTQIRASLPCCACEKHKVITLVPPGAELYAEV